MAALAARPCGGAYYSMVYYAAAASANLLLMHLNAGFNHLYAAQGKASANLYGKKLDYCIQYDRELGKNMAAFREGKWKGMEQAFHIGFTKWNSEDWRYPVRCQVYLPEEPRLVVSRADETRSYTNEYFPIPLEIDDFLEPGTEKVVIEAANGGQGTLEWGIEERYKSLELSAYEGKTSLTDEIEIRVNWDQVPMDMSQEFTFHIRTANEMVPLCVRVRRRDLEKIPRGAFPDLWNLGRRTGRLQIGDPYISR